MTLFPKAQTPYYIYTPSWTHKSSGVRTLHLLCHGLNELGQTAYLIPDNGAGFAVNPKLNTPVLEAQYQNFYQAEGVSPIVVYPDIIKGNPLGGRRVVRYLLAPAGAYGGDEVFPDTDQIWGALPSIAENVLRIPVSDTNVFYEGDQIREGSCFYSHKYEMHGNQLLDITNDSKRLEGSLEQLAHTLRNSTVCYLYELTSVITEAALCGCPVTLIRTPYFDKIDPSCMMGQVSWDDGELVKECSDYLPEYEIFVSNFWRNLLEFVGKTQSII